MTEQEKMLQSVLKFISQSINLNGFPPSVREICRHLNIASTATAQKYLTILEETGYIRKAKNCKRTLEIIKGEYLTSRRDLVQIPLLGKITAGKLKEAVPDYEDTFSFPSGLFRRGDLFMLNVSGDSMIDAGIEDGDKIVIRRQPTADNGQIVAALVDDETTVKRYFKAQDHYILHPENKAYEDIIVKNLEILGILVGLIRAY